MAALTWRNVAAPDFRGSQDGYRNASLALDRAASGLTSTLDNFQDSRQAADGSAALSDALRYQDPAALQAALSSGALTQGRNLSPEILKQLGNQASTLLANQGAAINNAGGNIRNDTATQALGVARYTDNRVRSGNALEDAAGDALRQGLVAARQNKQGDVNATFDLPEVRKLRPDQIATYLKNLDTASASSQTRATNDQSLIAKNFDFNNIVKNKADTDSATALQIELRNAADADGQRLILEKWAPGATPGARALAFQANAGLFGGQSPAGGGGGASLGSGASASGFSFGAPQKAVSDTLSQAGMSPAVVAGFMGNFHVEGGYDGAKGDGGSSSGIAQWRGERQTNFKNVIGKDVSQSTPAEQAQFVKWEMDNPEKAGMTISQRDQILAAKTPDAAADLIDQFYERSDGKARSNRVSAAKDAFGANPILGMLNEKANDASTLRERGLNRTERLSQNNALAADDQDFVAGLTESASKASETDVADKLMAGKFKGTDRNWVIRELRKNKEIYGDNINFTQIGNIMSRHLTADDTGFTQSFDRVGRRLQQYTPGGVRRTSNLGNGLRIDDAKAQQAMLDIKTGAANQRVLANAATADKSTEDAAEAKYTAAKAAYTAASVRAETVPGMASELPRLKKALDIATQARLLVKASVRGASDLQPERPPPDLPLHVISSRGW